MCALRNVINGRLIGENSGVLKIFLNTTKCDKAIYLNASAQSFTDPNGK